MEYDLTPRLATKLTARLQTPKQNLHQNLVFCLFSLVDLATKNQCRKMGVA
jgi:hypothetical protein